MDWTDATGPFSTVEASAANPFCVPVCLSEYQFPHQMLRFLEEICVCKV